MIDELDSAEAPDIEEAPFNMSMLFYMGLNKLIELKDMAYINNDMGGWYKALNRIYTKIFFKLNVEERQKLGSWFTSARDNRQGQGARNDLIKTLHGIDLEISLCLDKYKMIFPRIENKAGLDNVRKRYKLQ